MGCKRCFVAIGRVNRDLPIAAIAVQRVEDLCLSQRVDTLVYPRKRVGIRDRDSIKLPEVNAK